MGEYTKTAYAGILSDFIFGRQLSRLTSVLKLPPPYFRGRKEETDIPHGIRWEIRTIMTPDPTMPDFEPVDYVTYYPEWIEGVNIAMVDLMARLCYKYRFKLAPGSPFRAFGKRNAHGLSMAHTGNRLDLPLVNKTFEDLDFLINCLTRRVQQTYDVANHAQAVIHAKTQELQASENLIGQLEELIHDLHLENLGKDEQIAMLEAQLIPPPPPPVAEEGGDQGTGDVTVSAATKEEGPEEEDPEEVLFEESTEGEVTPVANNHAIKRKRNI